MEHFHTSLLSINFLRASKLNPGHGSNPGVFYAPVIKLISVVLFSHLESNPNIILHIQGNWNAYIGSRRL
jgi:hypothetical protein